VAEKILKFLLNSVLLWVCYGSLLAEIGDPEAISRKQHFIVPALTQQTPVQRLSPKNKGVSPYIPLQAGYRGIKLKNKV
jgi:hypothetical protein